MKQSKSFSIEILGERFGSPEKPATKEKLDRVSKELGQKYGGKVTMVETVVYFYTPYIIKDGVVSRRPSSLKEAFQLFVDRIRGRFSHK